MNRAMPTYADSISDSVVELKRFLDTLGDNPVIISHVDADGLCSAAILKRFLSRRGIEARQVYPDRGESAFTPGTETVIQGLKPTSLFVLDLGVMDKEIALGVPTAFIDHHRPFGRPAGAVILSSYGPEPAPPTAFLAYSLLSRVADIKDIEWLSAVGATGDLGRAFVFAHGDASVRQLKRSDVTEAEILINSAKRASAYDIDTAIGLIDQAGRVSDLLDHQQQAVRMLESYRAEVNREVKRCRHEKPQFSWKVAVVPFKSNCDIQGLIVEPWRRQLEKYLVIAANFGYLEGKVAYVIRTELETSVIDFMESIRPVGFDSHVVFGHDRAGGAVLDTDLWYRLADRMGFKDKG